MSNVVNNSFKLCYHRYTYSTPHVLLIGLEDVAEVFLLLAVDKSKQFFALRVQCAE